MKTITSFLKINALVVCFLGLSFFTGSIALAQDNPPPAPHVTTVTITNPLKFNTLQELIVAILNIFTTLMVPVMVFFIIYAGFKYVTAQGNPGKVEEASAMLTYAIIGGVLILAAVAIAEIIKNTVMSFTPPA